MYGFDKFWWRSKTEDCREQQGKGGEISTKTKFKTENKAKTKNHPNT